MQNQPTDIFEEGIFGYGDNPAKYSNKISPEEIARAKKVAVPATPVITAPTPEKPVNRFQKEQDQIMAIVDTLKPEVNQTVVLAAILREFTPEAREYIYKLSMK